MFLPIGNTSTSKEVELRKSTAEFLASMASDISVTPTSTISLDGLPGVPTRTTSTLTPTTLRNIEQTFIDLQSQVSHQNQAGFVPPVVQPVSQGSSFLVNLVDTRTWGGGSAVVGGDSHSSNDSSTTMHSGPSISPPANYSSPAPTPRRNTGGRRPIKDKNISPEEEERRQVRRERNKMAAARCRKRRVDHTNELLEETGGLEDIKKRLQLEIQKLQMEKEDLEFVLESHKVSCHLGRPGSPPDIKPFMLSDNKVFVQSLPEVKSEPSNLQKKPARPRPNSLPVATFNPRKMQSVTEIAGVPITTPTAGMPFNFDSLMEGGTGLTPVSGPMVPSCASQQRNGCMDLSSPDALPNKLVSL